MSLTISELEAERAKILDEIENKAQKFSGETTRSPEQSSLTNWLNAAEEVMPATPKTEKRMKKQARTKQSNTKLNYQSQVLKTPKNKAPFFGVLIMLTLLLTLLGVIYIAYNSIHKELQSVLESNKTSIEQMKKIQLDMVALQKSIATGGKVELFVSLEDQLFSLDSQVGVLKEQVNALQAQNKQTIDISDNLHPKSSSPVKEESIAIETPNVNETKENEMASSDKLEERIDQKLEAILHYISQDKQEKNLEKAGQMNETSRASHSSVKETVKNIASPKITPPSVPKVSEVKKPVIEQPLVQLVKPIKSPTTPAKVDAPLKHYSEDVKWLTHEPTMHYTLQLASMPEKHSLQEIVNKKQLQNTRILPQTRNGITNYILVKGSFSDRKLANDLAKQIKTEFGISPWIRKMKDLSSRLQ